MITTRNLAFKQDRYINHKPIRSKAIGRVPLISLLPLQSRRANITLSGVNPDSVQGDAQFPTVLEKMGCEVKKTADSLQLIGKSLNGITINMNNMPDAVQTLAVIALFAKGETVIEGISNLRIKETNRIEALANELGRLGAEVEAGEDFLIVKPGEYQGAEIETYNDHRMAMSFAVAGLKIPGVKIKDPKCVEKSFPDFFSHWPPCNSQ